MELAIQNAKKVDLAIRKANPQEGTSHSSSPLFSPSSTSPSHTLMNGLKIAPAHKAALEDLATAIHLSQEEKANALLVASGKGPVVPLLPPRSVKDQVALKAHRCWALSNINLLAPISIPMWQAWANLSSKEVESLKSNAVNNVGMLKDPQDIRGSFSLSMFDHHKCSTPDIKVHTKQWLQTGVGRSDKHSSTFWNCQRPYLRCICYQFTVSGCKGDVMWFDQATWYMINNLSTFLPKEFPTLSAKFQAFLVWVSEAAIVVVRHQIAFMHIRQMMCDAALEFAEDSTGKLLPSLANAQGARIIEKLIKPASFSINNPSTPGVNHSGKRSWSKMNLNVVPEASGGTSNVGRGRGYHRGSGRGGRGGFNRNSRSNNRQTHGPNDAFVFLGPRQGPSVTKSSVSLALLSPDGSLDLADAPTPSYSTPSTQSPRMKHSESSST